MDKLLALKLFVETVDAKGFSSPRGGSTWPRHR